MSEFDTIVGLVSEYSPSGKEGGAVTWLVARMKALGYEKAFIDDAGNAIGVIGEGPRLVVLLGHIDTVPGQIPVARISDSSPAEKGELLYGRGAVDAKGPLACFVDAAAKVGRKTGWQFVVIGAVEEERDSAGARFIMDRYKPDFAIIGEPTRWDRVALGYKGSAWVSVTIQRPQAHTASGEETAAESAVEVWLKIKAHAAEFNRDKQKVFDQLLLTLQAIESGSNEFEQSTRLKLGVRLPVEVSPDDWYGKLEEILKSSESSTVSIERTGFAIPAWKCEKNTQLVRALLIGIRSNGGEPRFVYKTGTADLNIIAPVWKCPTVVYGPGDSSLDHTPNEHLALEEYAKAVQILCTTLHKLGSELTY